MAQMEVGYDEAQALYAAAFRMARRLDQDPLSSSDFAQEAVVRAIADWERVREHALPWVSRVVANLVVDDWRRRNRLPRFIRRTPIEAASEGNALDLVQALGRLPKRQREAVVFRYLMDLSQEQTAEAMGCSVGSVRQHTTRGLGTLKEILGTDYLATSGRRDQ